MQRTNRDGSVVRYLQFALDERHPETGSLVAKVVHNFGRAEVVDRAGLGQLVSSISRFLTSEQAVTVAAGVEVEILDCRRTGGAWTLDRVWERLGIGAAIRRVADRRRGRGTGAVRPGRAAGGHFPTEHTALSVCIWSLESRPHRTGQGTMDHAVEAGAQRVRDHLRRPQADSRKLLMETAG